MNKEYTESVIYALCYISYERHMNNHMFTKATITEKSAKRFSQ